MTTVLPDPATKIKQNEILSVSDHVLFAPMELEEGDLPEWMTTPTLPSDYRPSPMKRQVIYDMHPEAAALADGFDEWGIGGES